MRELGRSWWPQNSPSEDCELAVDVFDRALHITDLLAATVTDLEIHCAKMFERSIPPRDRLAATIQTIWPDLVADARQARVSAKVNYVAALYDRLTQTAGIADPQGFVDRIDLPWFVFYTEGCGDETRCEDAWVVAYLFWNGYMQHLHLTLGWLLMNAIRVQQHLSAIYPAPETIDRFTDSLRWSGPDLFDAESLRSLFSEYERQTAG